MRYLLIYLFLISCNNKQEQKKTININQPKKLVSITCSLKSLDGELEIYKIVKDSIYSSDKKDNLNIYEYKKIMNVPKEIYERGGKYGCGVCIDEVDYIFSFDYGNKKINWEIEPNVKLPNETKEYFSLLIDKYKQFVDI